MILGDLVILLWGSWAACLCTNTDTHSTAHTVPISDVRPPQWLFFGFQSWSTIWDKFHISWANFLHTILPSLPPPWKTFPKQSYSCLCHPNDHALAPTAVDGSHTVAQNTLFCEYCFIVFRLQLFTHWYQLISPLRRGLLDPNYCDPYPSHKPAAYIGLGRCRFDRFMSRLFNVTSLEWTQASTEHPLPVEQAFESQCQQADKWPPFDIVQYHFIIFRYVLSFDTCLTMLPHFHCWHPVAWSTGQQKTHEHSIFSWHEVVGWRCCFQAILPRSAAALAQTEQVRTASPTLAECMAFGVSTTCILSMQGSVLISEKLCWSLKEEAFGHQLCKQFDAIR